MHGYRHALHGLLQLDVPRRLMGRHLPELLPVMRAAAVEAGASGHVRAARGMVIGSESVQAQQITCSADIVRASRAPKT